MSSENSMLPPAGGPAPLARAPDAPPAVVATATVAAAIPAATAPAAGSRTPPVPLRTRNQVRAASVADGLAARAKWKRVIGEARTTWDKLGGEELARIDGNFHKLAGLVQLRYRVTREESDRQVHAFFDKHYAAN